jgi:DNA-binding PadR family transcriptional regulator
MERRGEPTIPGVANYLPLSALLKPLASKEDTDVLVEIWKSSESHDGRLVVKSGVNPAKIRMLIEHGFVKGNNYLASSLMPEQVIELTEEGKQILRERLLAEQSTFQRRSCSRSFQKVASSERPTFNLSEFRRSRK